MRYSVVVQGEMWVEIEEPMTCELIFQLSGASLVIGFWGGELGRAVEGEVDVTRGDWGEVFACGRIGG